MPKNSSLRERMAGLRRTPQQQEEALLEKEQQVHRQKMAQASLDIVAAANNLRTFLSSQLPVEIDEDRIVRIEERVRLAFPQAFDN